jgi:hypothetical protein
MNKLLSTMKSKLGKTTFRNKFTFIIGFAVIGLAMLTYSSAASLVTVEVDFSAQNSQPNFYPYEESHIRIQRNGGGPDAALLENIGTKHERSFVRLDKWKPTPNSSLKTEQGRYGLGDSWLEDMNQRGVAPWVTFEVDTWKKLDYESWYINAPISATEQKQYEDLIYEIIMYIKNKSPQTELIEMLNEPNLGKWKLNTDDQVKLYLSSARVVNRINAELSLPKPGKPKLIHGGPSSIKTAFEPNPRTNEIQFKDWVDGVFAAPDFDQIKPAYFSYHRFGPAARPSSHKSTANLIRNYLDDPKFQGKWKNVPIWSTAYSPGSSQVGNDDGDDTTFSDPATFNPTETSRGTSGFAAIHYYMMEGNVTYTSMFAQSSYTAYKHSILLPESQSVENKIPYYKAGLKTPLYNYYEMLSKINGTRVRVNSSGTGAINSDGQGYGTDAVRDNNKGWVLSWNYDDTGAGTPTDVTYNLNGLNSIGIDNNESATVNVYLIDNKTSNITAGDNTKDDLQIIDTLTLPAGSTRKLNYSVSGLATVLFEIVGKNDSGNQPDTTPPIVNLTSPVANSLISGFTQLIATSSDNVQMKKVEFLVDGNIVGQDTSIADTTYSFNLDTNTLTNGSHLISARATDASNNTKTTTAYTINVNNIQVVGCDPSSVTAPINNLLPNYSFEVKNSGLNAIGTASFSWLDTGAKSGKCFVQITSTDPNGSEISQRYVGPITDVPVTPGTEYELTGWVKTVNATSGASIRMNFWSGPNSADFMSGSSIISSSQTGSTDWTNINAGTIVAPEGAQFARIELRLAGSGTAQFDDVSIRKIISTTPPIDTQPPTVNIQGDSTIVASNDLNIIKISAADNGSINRVELKVVGGAILATDTSPPYDISLNPNSLANGDYNLVAIAYDSSNNSTTSSPKIIKVRLPDINRNGKVEIGDLTFIISAWNQSNSSIQTKKELDLNDDGVIGISDLTILISKWSL